MSSRSKSSAKVPAKAPKKSEPDNLYIKTINDWNGTPQQAAILQERVPNEELALEIIGLIIDYNNKGKSGYDEVLRLLDEHGNDFYWKQPVYYQGQADIYNEIALTIDVKRGTTGVGKCRFCGSNEIIYGAPEQFRSGDEGLVVKAQCVRCSRTWRV